jgi:hypothetical protein
VNETVVSRFPNSRTFMQMKNLIHDLPFAIQLEQRKQIGEPVA